MGLYMLYARMDILTWERGQENLSNLKTANLKNVTILTLRFQTPGGTTAITPGAVVYSCV